MSATKKDTEARFYLISQGALPRLRDLAAAAPVLRGEDERVEEIRSHFREAPVQYQGSREYMATVMAFLDDTELLTEMADGLRANLELHIGGRVTIYATDGNKRAQADPSRIDTRALQRYWEEEQFQKTNAGREIHDALMAFHANLVAADDEAVLLVHW